MLRVLILTGVILYTIYSYSEYKNNASGDHTPWGQVEALFRRISRFLRDVIK